jgi:hypothetical protein
MKHKVFHGFMSVFQALPPTPRRYLYSDVVVGLVWSNNAESCSGGSVATSRASHDGQVKGDDPDKKGSLGSPDWGLEHETNNPTSVKTSLNSLIINAAWIILVSDWVNFMRIIFSVLLLAMYSVYGK